MEDRKNIAKVGLKTRYTEVLKLAGRFARNFVQE